MKCPFRIETSTFQSGSNEQTHQFFYECLETECMAYGSGGACMLLVEENETDGKADEV